MVERPGRKAARGLERRAEPGLPLWTRPHAALSGLGGRPPRSRVPEKDDAAGANRTPLRWGRAKGRFLCGFYAWILQKGGV